MVVQATWVLAGSAGFHQRYGDGQSDAPVAGVKIRATLPSQTKSVTTDSKGFTRFRTSRPTRVDEVAVLAAGSLEHEVFDSFRSQARPVSLN